MRDQFIDIADQIAENGVYASFNPETADAKKALYSALSNPSHKISDWINKPIAAKDIVIEEFFITQDEVEKKVTRVVIIDENGVSYGATSFGVFSAIKRIINIFGAPTWNEPITLIPVQVERGKGKMVSLEIG